MSLISDALQKAESRSTPRLPASRPPSRWGWRAGLAVGAVAVLAGLLLLPHGRKTNPGKPAALPTTPAVQRVPFLAERQMALNGILREEGGKPLALIGNHIVAEGESFAGTRVVRIGQADVELERNGKVTTLTLND